MPAVWGGRALAVVAGLLALAPAAQARETYSEVVTTRDLELRMSDGVLLRADLYQPAVGGKAVKSLPTVVIKFPYNKDDSSRSERKSVGQLARAGFAGLVVDS